MTTANEDVWADSTQTTRARVQDRGSGRIDLTKAGTPGLTLDQPSISAGEVSAGGGAVFSIEATDVSGAASTWSVSAVETAEGANFDIDASPASLTVPANGSARLSVDVDASGAAEPGSYEGEVVLENAATGRTLHVPVWLRVLPTLDPGAVKDVLLVDDDGSSAVPEAFHDYSQVYEDTLSALGLSYDYVDPWNDGFPPLFALYGYRAVVIFTGDNDSFDTSGFTPTDQNTLTEWLDSGGKLWTIGQNFAETSDSNADFSSEKLGRARLYHGYLGLEYQAGSAYGVRPAPSPTADGKGPMEHLTLDLGPDGDGAGNQSSIEASTPLADNDTYEATDTMIPMFVPRDDDVRGGKNGIAFGRSSEPSLMEERQKFRYRSLSMGFGLEGVNSDTGFATRQQVASAAWRWLADTITFGPVAVTPKAGKDPTKVTIGVTASSSVAAAFTKFRWDFGDSHGADSKKPTAEHDYKKTGDYVVRVEATDDLGHTAISKQTVHIG